MTRDEIVAIIKQRLKNNTNTELDDLIVSEMQLNQSLLEQEASLPWFLFATGSTSVSANTATVILDSYSRGGTACSFLAEYEPIPFATYLTATETSEDKQFMSKDDYTPLWNGKANISAKNSKPTKYANDPLNSLQGAYRVFPIPASPWTLVAPGYYADVPLSSNITNLWLTYAPDLIIGKVGAIIAGQYEAMTASIPQFMEQEQKARDRLMRLNSVKQEENIRRMMGDS